MIESDDAEDSDTLEIAPLTKTPQAESGHLAPLVDRARVYVEASSSANTRRAYASD